MKLTHALILASLSGFSAAHGAALLVDFSADAGTQTGWESLGGTADGTPKSGTYSGYTDLAAGDITVTLTDLEFNRGYNNGTGAGTDFTGTDLDAMYADILFRNDAGQTIDIIISGLDAGTFQFTTHHLIASPSPGTFDFIVTDSTGTSTLGNYAMGTGSVGASPTFNPTVITFQVVSNGVDDIVLQMDATTLSNGGNTGGWFGVNGMEIGAIPEPSSFALLGLGGLALLRRRR